MDIALAVIAGVLLLFGFVVAFGAPYLPTLSVQTDEALDMLDLKSGQTLLELGSGDGRVLLAAAKRGIRGVGYELNPLLVMVAWVVTWRYRRLVTIRWGNYWQKTWPAADGIYVFLLDRYMARLDKKVARTQTRPVRLVSYAFMVPGKKPVMHRNGLYLYAYPMRRGSKGIEK